MIKLATTKALDTGALIVVLNFTDPLGNPVPAPELLGQPAWSCDNPAVKLEPVYNATSCAVSPPAGVPSATITARTMIRLTGQIMEGSTSITFGALIAAAIPGLFDAQIEGGTLFTAGAIRKGQRVSWLAAGATVRGQGQVISEEENGRVLVAVDGGVFDAIPVAYHMVIHCTVTWLTPET